MDWLNVIGVIAGIVGSTAAIMALRPQWGQWQKQRAFERDFGSDFFPSPVLERSTRYYVEPYCANVDPNREAEIRNVVSTKQNLFDVIDDFLSSDSIYRHLIILADSGMGKTAGLLNYYLYNRKKPRRKRHRIAVIPLGIPDVESHIQAIKQQRETILFLDAFDEDTKAIEEHRTRLLELMELSRDFSHIILTCRTQFFLHDEEIPLETGIVRMGPRKGKEGKTYTFQKLYLQPFTDKQVDTYLQKRYTFWHWKKRRIARQTIMKVPNLSVRPMLLEFIPELLEIEQIDITYSFELYEALIEAWIEREKGWIAPDKLRQFSKRLAVDIFVNRKKRGTERIPREELLKLIEEWQIPLEDWQITGRSLLNRDAEGNYKFAHRSIMEYLHIHTDIIGLEIDWQKIEPTDQMQMFVKEMIKAGRLEEFRTLSNFDLKEANLKGVKLEGVNLFGANLQRAKLEEANLIGAHLQRAKLEEANLFGANLQRANLFGANLQQAKLEGVNLFSAYLFGANLQQANLFGANLQQAKLEGANLFGTNLQQAKLEGANLFGANLQQAKLEEANLQQTRYDQYTRWPIDFDPTKAGAIKID